MKLSTLTAATFLLAASTALAQTTLDGVVQSLRDQGFTEIEIDQHGGKTIIEAKGNGMERTLIYDADGKIISDVVERDGDGEHRSGAARGDGHDDDDEDDDDHDDDDDDDHGGDDHDGGDDHGGGDD